MHFWRSARQSSKESDLGTMPEGPEVEVVRRGLSSVLGQKIEHMLVSSHHKYRDLNPSLFANKEISAIDRHGKYLVWCFASEEETLHALNHLGMTGIWRLFSASRWEEEYLEVRTHKDLIAHFKHYKVFFVLSSGDRLLFDDPRTFGFFRVMADRSELPELGPDLLAESFDLETFKANIRGKGRLERRQEIGKLLLDQRIVAGCGNIYKSEALFLAHINPFTPANHLDDEDLENLVSCLKTVMEEAVMHGGSSIRDFNSVEGYQGLMQNRFKVYGRENESCILCGHAIVKTRQGGRSTFYCPSCQNVL